MRANHLFKKIISWALIIMLVMPNVAFAAVFTPEVTVEALFPDDTAVGNALDNLVLNLYDDINKTTLIKSYDLAASGSVNLSNDVRSDVLPQAVYYGQIASTSTNFFVLPSDLVPIDVTNAIIENTNYTIKFKSPKLTGTVFGPDGITPFTGGNTSVGAGPTSTAIANDGMYTLDVFSLSHGSHEFYATTTAAGFLNSSPVQVDTANFSDGNFVQNFTLRSQFLKVTVKDPLDTTAITNIGVHISNKTPGSNLQFDTVNGTFYATGATNGEYEIYFSSREADTYAYSAPVHFYYLDGAAYYNQEHTTPIDSVMAILLRDSIYFGNALDSDGLPTTNVNIFVNQPDTYTLLGGFEPKPDGSIYLPKVDGTFNVGINPKDQTSSIGDQQIVTVSGSGTVITGNRDLQLKAIQLTGQVFGPGNVAINSQDYWVDIYSTNGTLIGQADKYDSNGTDYYYKLAGLPEGSYYLVLNPGGYFTGMGYAPSIQMPFTVDVLGVPSVNPINIAFRVASAIPIEIYRNNMSYMPLPNNMLTVDVDLKYASATQTSQISATLIKMAGDGVTPLITKVLDNVDIPSQFLENRPDNVKNYRARFYLDEFILEDGVSYVLKITDSTKTEGNQTDDTSVMATSAPLYDFTNYLGVEDLASDKYYHHVNIWNAPEMPVNVTIYNASDVACGSGQLTVFNPMLKTYLLTSTLEVGATPVYYEMDGVVTTYKRFDNANYFTMESQTHDFMIQTDSDASHYYIKLYNQSITPELFDNIEIKQFVNNAPITVYPNDPYTAYIKEAHADLMGGVVFKIPIAAFPGNRWNEIMLSQVQTGWNSYGQFYLENEATQILTATVKTPEATPQTVTNFNVWSITDGESLNHHYDIINGKFILGEAQDGTYKFVFSSNVADLFGMSAPLTVHVFGGKAYSDALHETLMVNPQEVALQNGILVGNMVDQENAIINSGTLSIKRVINEFESEYMGGFNVKSDGSIVIPKIDGTYDLQLMPNYQMPDSFGFIQDNLRVVVSGEAITGARDMQLIPAQISGKVRTYADEAITNGDFILEVYDSAMKLLQVRTRQDCDGTESTYLVGGLTEGTYYIVARPGMFYSNTTEASSSPVAVTVDAIGVAAPAVADINFRNSNFIALEIVENNVNYVPINREDIEVEVGLQYSTTTLAADISCELIYKIGTGDEVVMPLENIAFEQLRIDQGNQTKYYNARYWLDGYRLIDNEVYTLRVSDTSKGEGYRTDTTTVTATSKGILGYTGYIGFVGETYYHGVSLENAPLGSWAVILLDETEQTVGTGTLSYDVGFDSYVMISTMNGGGTPTHFTVNDSDFVYKNQYANEYRIDEQKKDYFAKVTYDEANYKINIYSSYLQPGDIDSIVVRSWQNDNEVQIFPQGSYTTFGQLDLADLMGGVTVTIPRAAFEGNTRCNVEFTVGEDIRGFGNLFFEDPLTSQFIGTVWNPDHTQQIYNFTMNDTYRSEGAEYQIDFYNGKFNVHHATNGQFKFAVSSNELDDYTLAEPLILNVVAGKPYWDEAATLPIISPITVDLRTGLLVGYMVDQADQVTTGGSYTIDRIFPEYWENIGSLSVKPDGKILIPNVDGTYNISLWPGFGMDGYVNDTAFVEITGGVLTGGRNLKLQPVQLSGTVTTNLGEPIPNGEFHMEILDSDKQPLNTAGIQDYNGTDYIYKIGGLPEGQYYVALYPDGSNTSLYGKSVEVPFAISNLGIATPNIIDLSFRLLADMPMEISDFYRSYYSTSRSDFEVDVVLRYAVGTEFVDFTASLVRMDGETELETIPLTTVLDGDQMFEIWQDGAIHFRARYDLGVYQWVDGSIYKLKITDGVKTGETFITATHKGIVGKLGYLGLVGGTYYHVLGIENPPTTVATVTVYNESEGAVGSGDLIYDSTFNAFIMTTTLEGGAVPHHYSIDGTEFVYDSPQVTMYNTESQTYEYLTEVTSDATHYYINLYNQALVPSTLTDFSVIEFTEAGMTTIFPSVAYPDYTKSVLVDRMGGVKIAIPKGAIPGNKWYDLSFKINGEDRFTQRQFFIDLSSTVFAAVVKDPTGTNQIMDFSFQQMKSPENTTLQMEIVNGKMIITEATDGDYSFAFFSNENDTYAISAPYNFTVFGGVAYTDTAHTTPISGFVSINLQTGVIIGQVTDGSAHPMGGSADISLDRFNTGSQNYEWLGQFRAKYNGNIVIPTVNGTYQLWLSPYDGFDQFVGKRYEVTIAGGTYSGDPLQLMLYQIQVKGRIFESAGTPITKHDYAVEIVDNLGANVAYAFHYYIDGTGFYYKTGALPAGSYSLILMPGQYYRDLGYMNSAPAAFTIDGSGNSNLPNIDLTFGTIPANYVTLQQLITKAEGIVLIGMTSDSKTPFTSALNAAKSVLPEASSTVINDAMTALQVSMNGLQVIKPVLTANPNTLTKLDVTINVALGFDKTGTGYNTDYRIGVAGSWVPLSGTTLTATMNQTVYVRTTYLIDGVLHETLSDPLVIDFIDREKPIISLAGDKIMTLGYGVNYVEPGFTVYDNKSTILPGQVIINNTVNKDVIGTYTVTYTATDEAGNSAVVVRTVTVVDKIAPLVDVQKSNETSMENVLVLIGSKLQFKVAASDAYANTFTTQVTMNGVDIPVPAPEAAGLYEVALASGINYLKVTVKDQSNNISQEVVEINNVVMILTPSTTALTNQPVVITATVPGNITAVPTYTPSNTQTADVNGSFTFTAFVPGYTTESKAYTYVVNNIDLVIPTTPVLAYTSNAPTNTTVYLTLTGSDILEYKIGAGSWVTYTGSIAVDANATVYGRARDAAGNISPETSLVVNWIDKAAPVITSAPVLSLDGVPFPVDASGVKVKVGQIITLAYTVTDGNPITAYVQLNNQTAVPTIVGSGAPIVYTVPLPIKSSAPSTVRVWFADALGNKVDAITVKSGFVIDVFAPTMTLLGGNMTIPLNSTFVDPSVMIYDDIDLDTLSPVVTGAVNTAIADVYTLQYNVSDAAGNASPPLFRTVTVVDAAKPIIDTSLITQTVSKAAFSFTASAIDNDEVSTFIVAHKGVPVVGDLGTYSVLLDEGANAFVITAIDPSSNTETKSYTVTYVKPPTDQPVISASTMAPTNQPITVTIEYPDGAFERLYALGSPANWLNYTVPLTVNSAPVTVYAAARQTAESELSQVVSLLLNNYDATSPVQPTFTPSTTAPTKNDITMVISGEGTIYYSIGQAIDPNGSLATYQIYSGPLTIGQNTTLYAMSVDAAKNKSAVVNRVISNIDKVPPVAYVEYSTVTPTKNSVFATLIVNEAYEMSGATLRYHEFATNGTHRFDFTDLAGNAGTITAEVNTIDKSLPVIGTKLVKIAGSDFTAVKGGDLVDFDILVTDASAVTAKVSLGTIIVDVPLTVTATGVTNQTRLTGNMQMPADFSGTADLLLTVLDAATNRVEQVLKSAVVIDNIKPVFNVTLAGPVTNGYITADVLTPSVQNDGSIILFGNAPTTITEPIATLSTALNALAHDGESYTIYFKATDAVGNVSDVKSLSFKWDSTHPATPSILIDEPAVTNHGIIRMSGVVAPGTVTVKRTLDVGTETIYQGPSSAFVLGIDVWLKEGLNSFTIVSTDAAGNASGVGTYQITYDGIAPVIEMIMDPITRDITVTASETLINPDPTPESTDLVYQLDGIVQADLVFTNNVASIDGDTIVGDGEHFLVITGKDAAGNIGTGRLSIVTVPANEPVTKELSDGIIMTEGTFTEAGELTVNTFYVAAGDDTSFIGEPINFELTGDATVDQAKGVTIDLSIGLGYPENTRLYYYEGDETGIWSPLNGTTDDGDSFYNSDPLNSITVYVHADYVAPNFDIINNIAAGATATLEVAPGHLVGFMRHFSGYAVLQDITPPTVQILTSEPANPVNAAAYNILVSVSEDSDVTVTINGVPATASKLAGEHTYNMPLVPGINRFEVKAVDAANLSSATAVFEVEQDVTNPVMTATIVGVDSGSTIRETSVVVNVTVTESNFSQVTVNGTVFTTPSVSTAVALTEGLNTIQVIAIDTAGNQTPSTLTVTRDTLGPDITINGIASGDIISGDISATVTGNPTYTWTLSSASVTVTGSNTPVSYIVPAGLKDTFTLVVDATDAVGNLTRETITFSVDQGAPMITSNVIPELSNQSQTVNIRVVPMASDTQVKVYKNEVRINDIEIIATPNGGLDATDYALTVTTDGVYRVTVDALNGSSFAIKTLNFTIDKTAPTITVSGVAQGQTYTAQPTIVFSSDSPITATLTKSGEAPVVIGTNYKVLENGSYTLALSSTDGAGNTATQNITFTVNVTAVVPGGDGGSSGGVPGGSTGLPTTPPVIENTLIEERFTKTIGQTVMIFEALNIEIDLSNAIMGSGTEIIVKSYSVDSMEAEVNLGSIEAKNPNIMKNQMTFVLASRIYEFTASRKFTGSLEITMPYDSEAVTRDEALSVAWYDRSIGKWVLLGGRIDKVNHTITFKTTHFSYYMIVEGHKTFTDIKAYGWAKDAIEILASRGIVNGYDVNTFKPGSQITRAEFATLLVNALSLNKKGATMTYKDVKDEWYKASIEIAASQGLLSGYNGYLMPSERITREQMAVMIINAYKLELGLTTMNSVTNTFADVDQMSDWSVDSIAKAAELGILSGKGNNLFIPKSYANRAEAAAMIYKLLGILE